jgi:hypothetical protein
MVTIVNGTVTGLLGLRGDLADAVDGGLRHPAC